MPKGTERGVGKGALRGAGKAAASAAGETDKKKAPARRGKGGRRKAA